jgi:hypothetical protein
VILINKHLEDNEILRFQLLQCFENVFSTEKEELHHLCENKEIIHVSILFKNNGTRCPFPRSLKGEWILNNTVHVKAAVHIHIIPKYMPLLVFATLAGKLAEFRL